MIGRKLYEAEQAEAALEALRETRGGGDAALIGEIGEPQTVAIHGQLVLGRGPSNVPGGRPRLQIAYGEGQRLVSATELLWRGVCLTRRLGDVAAIQSAGARVEPLPPYSPDETPIEELFSKTKTFLRKIAARTTETVMQAFGDALNLVTSWDCIGWFIDRCAYAFH